MPSKCNKSINRSIVEDKALLKKLQKGDNTAFEYIYNTHADALFNILLKMVNCLKTSEDLLLNVFIKAYSKISQYNADRGKLFTWLINLTRNEAMEHLRNNNSKEILTEKDSLATNLNCHFDRIELMNLLHLLPAKERAIMTLVTMGYANIDISKIVKLPTKIIKSKVRTSYKILLHALVKDC